MTNININKNKNVNKNINIDINNPVNGYTKPTKNKILKIKTNTIKLKKEKSK